VAKSSSNIGKEKETHGENGKERVKKGKRSQCKMEIKFKHTFDEDGIN
jgi:hypothetical protein